MHQATFGAREVRCYAKDEECFIYNDSAVHLAYYSDRCSRPIGPFASYDARESHRGITVTVDSDTVELKKIVMRAETMVPEVEASFKTSHIHEMSDLAARETLSKVVVNRGLRSDLTLASGSAIEFALLAGEGKEISSRCSQSSYRVTSRCAALPGMICCTIPILLRPLAQQGIIRYGNYVFKHGGMNMTMMSHKSNEATCLTCSRSALTIAGAKLKVGSYSVGEKWSAL